MNRLQTLVSDKVRKKKKVWEKKLRKGKRISKIKNSKLEMKKNLTQKISEISKKMFWKNVPPNKGKIFEKKNSAKKNLLEKIQVEISKSARKNQTWHNVALIFERHGGACYIGLRSWIMDPVGTKSIFDSVFWKSTFSIKIRSKIDLWFFWNNFFRDGTSWPKSVSIRKIIFEMQ